MKATPTQPESGGTDPANPIPGLSLSGWKLLSDAMAHRLEQRRHDVVDVLDPIADRVEQRREKIEVVDPDSGVEAILYPAFDELQRERPILTLLGSLLLLLVAVALVGLVIMPGILFDWDWTYHRELSLALMTLLGGGGLWLGCEATWGDVRRNRIRSALDDRGRNNECHWIL